MKVRMKAGMEMGMEVVWMVKRLWDRCGRWWEGRGCRISDSTMTLPLCSSPHSPLSPPFPQSHPLPPSALHVPTVAR